MTNIYRSLLLVIAGASQKELARQIKYLRVENQILRSRLPRQVLVTPKERARLVKFAGKLAAKVLGQLVTIVHPETLLRWVREDRRGNRKQPPAWRGRPRTPEQLRRLIRRMARENDWGYTRIMGELKKLGIQPPSRNTVKNILKAVGLDPGPQRGEATWDDFLQRHAVSLWQCDFFSRRVLTLGGIRQAFVLAFIHVQTRRVDPLAGDFQAGCGMGVHSARSIPRRAEPTVGGDAAEGRVALRGVHHVPAVAVRGRDAFLRSIGHRPASLLASFFLGKLSLDRYTGPHSRSLPPGDSRPAI